MTQRQATLERKSRETEIKAELHIDGKGQAKISTPVGLLNHMLELMTFHGCFDLVLSVQKADLDIDIHHTNEDVGIVLGKVFLKALGDKTGIRRFGSAFAPMEATLGHTVVDISGRGHFTLKMNNVPKSAVHDQEGYSLEYLEHFLESFAKGLGATIVVSITDASQDLHTTIETVFKSLGMALDQATQLDPRREGLVPSTKGIID